MGTVTPPAARAAKSAMTHSGLFSERMARRSPGFRPRAWKPSERRRTVVSTSSVEIFSQTPSLLNVIRPGFLYVRQESRNRRQRVLAPRSGMDPPQRALLYTFWLRRGRGNLAVLDDLDELSGLFCEGRMGGGEAGQLEGPLERPGVVVAGGAVVLAGRLGRLDPEGLGPLFGDETGLSLRRHLRVLDLADLFLQAFFLVLVSHRGPGEIDPRIEPVLAVRVELAQAIGRVARRRIEVEGLSEVPLGVVGPPLPIGDDP